MIDCIRRDTTWIGYQDIRDEGDYRCYDSLDVPYSNFEDGAPKNTVSFLAHLLHWHNL